MQNLSEFCTCKDTKCPFNPQNHSNGCAPCIRKCLIAKEIPSCFFNMLGETEKPEGYTFADFAKLVLAHEGLQS